MVSLVGLCLRILEKKIDSNGKVEEDEKFEA
jgi:hypothetical protein